mmetsp:Transcript_75306/g.232918  ORF Transcript_75306/g.232918 Transcript_75306/m.232918 type:complete len:518 (-) Transcript_75306:262-1815(-)|eukprot:CAMPEP_0204574014 /NCGR_PEP_ID=MMETSP0661-20131031/40356_1 /ASSEMBLY_ACC=CAM_ASM_000606 /TAXON_ID=109239 /ORGANISM="Alexandrium margalefi, Strain AMGDE01CS-322" /LENGTH=517 /DNA_ID=CAMNT_0051582501 /DNA_START=78 /DNA_END=1631 /DNA_ORIENTATION=+
MAVEESYTESDDNDLCSTPSAHLQGHDSILQSTIVFILCIGVSEVVLIEAACIRDKSPPGANEQEADSFIGVPSAAGAAILFGSVFLPYSLRSLDRVHPVGRGLFIVMFSSLGNGLAHLTLIVVMRIFGQLTRMLTATQVLCGFMGGVLLTGTAALSYFASRWAGVATVAPVLSSTGMLTSYLWGIVIFKEPVKDMRGCCLGLACLMAGAVVCSVAQTSAPQRLQRLVLGGRNAEETLVQSPPSAGRSLEHRSLAHSTRGRSLGAVGILMAVTAGVFDGTLMVPYKLFTIQFSGSVGDIEDTTRIGSTVTDIFNQTHHIDHVVERTVDDAHVVTGIINQTAPLVTNIVNKTVHIRRAVKRTIHDVPLINSVVKQTHRIDRAVQRTIDDAPNSKDASYVYLQGLSSTLLVLSGMMWLSLRTAYRDHAKDFALHQQICFLPGVSAGVLWAMGNMCSIRASQYLGLAVGFPLTQTCCGVSAVWGIALLGEMQQASQRVACFTGVSCVLWGGWALSANGTE